jgi:hypothetical protein
MAGLGDMFGSTFGTVNSKKPRNSDRIQPAQPLNLRGAFEAATNVPVVGDALSGVMAAYDAAKGDYGSAAMNALGVLPFVSGTFIGKGAKTWDAVKEADALSRLAKGDNAADVWKATGVGQAPWDKALRGEIDDSVFELTEAARNRFTPGTIQPLGQKFQSSVPNAIDHKQLTEAYPEWMRDIEIRESPQLNGGSFSSSEHILDPKRRVGFIKVAQSGDDPKSTIAHELQHAIQQREGWARGGSPEQFKVHPEMMGGLHSIDDMMRAELIMNRAKEYGMSIQDFTKNPARWMDDKSVSIARQFDGKPKDFKYAKDYVIGAHDPNEAYQRLAGEAEARLTQARMNLTPAERLAQFPYEPEYFKKATGVDINDLIVRGGDGPAMSVTKPDGTSKISQRMTEAFSKSPADEVGFIEPNHLAKWGQSDPKLFFGNADAAHSTKRIGEGVTPEEFAEIAYRATQKNAHAVVEPNGYLKLTSPIAMKFQDSPPFKPQAIVRNVDGENHLFGVIPKGWGGRK